MSNTMKYSQEQMDIALMKKDQSIIQKTLERIEQRLDKLDQKVDSHFHWTLGLIFGMYAMGLTGLIGALGHAYGWF
jgi:uncharacterized membrane-anchored protein YhcB (DUF1043 family)